MERFHLVIYKKRSICNKKSNSWYQKNKVFIDIKNLNFWYQKIIFYIKNSEFFLYKKMINWYQKIRILDIRKRFFDIKKKYFFLYEELFIDIKNWNYIILYSIIPFSYIRKYLKNIKTAPRIFWTFLNENQWTYAEWWRNSGIMLLGH